ncbi:MAG TPA: hypothetical protein VG146_18715 [Verrucomicrobiae bacterium]|nr:hypothetical protein [Verrucomicrobiae bacterium]
MSTPISLLATDPEKESAEYQGYVRANKFVALSICSIVIAMVRNLTALLC